MLFDGTVEAELEGFDFAPIVAHFAKHGVETVAVCFMNAYVNDANERFAAAGLKELTDGIPVCSSAQVVRERGEYERFSTTVLNAYLTPVMHAYLGTLTAELEASGVAAPVNIMASNGGAMTLAQAADFVVGTFLSGPVGGVTGALKVAETAGIDDCITFDMGGTSTDVALVHGLSPRISHANFIDAFPLQVPQLDIHTIGAGGGSIVWVQPDGTLEIGPQSAGAEPGPACYQRGGTEPTMSDANLLLGRLPTARALSGGLELAAEPAEAAFRGLAEKLEGGADDVVRLADGALQIAVAKMAGAVREVSVHRGFDPREFTLVGFGGAGPMHVLMVAGELAIPRVIIPRLPGHVSALGQLLADYRRDSVLAWGGRLGTLELAELRRQATGLRGEASRRLDADGIAQDRQEHSFTVDMRYAGQSFTLSIPWNEGDDSFTPLRQAFDDRHAETFGFADKDNEAEIVNLRLVSIGRVDKPEVSFTPEAGGEVLLERRPVWFGNNWCDCPVYDRAAMPKDFALEGPAIIEEAGGTTVVPPGWQISMHISGALDCTGGA